MDQMRQLDEDLAPLPRNLRGAILGTRIGRLLLAGALAALLGGALLAALARGQAAAGFAFRGALARFITPNGDGKNDVAILCLENPRDSAVGGTVYDLRGQTVSGMVYVKDTTAAPPGTLPGNCKAKFGQTLSPAQFDVLTWDGRSGGRAAPSGAYIYQVQSEEATITGLLVVAR